MVRRKSDVPDSGKSFVPASGRHERWLRLTNFKPNFKPILLSTNVISLNINYSKIGGDNPK